MAQQAQDTFSAEIDGVPLFVQRGQVFPDSHPVVKLDAGRGLLFRPLDLDSAAPEPPAKSGPETPAGDVPATEVMAEAVTDAAS